jgi:hypothetical protein
MPKPQRINPDQYLKELQRKTLEALSGKDIPPGSYVVTFNNDGTVKEITRVDQNASK